ncbi:hypothetical protein E2C01_073564 [Portunus trituberculatus]|uniref:Uncharacterized protein n=1 Tax=Portunus trituberculatus TaxID=210409 RepID=A0A5B7I5N9_PORTR|nr:hypothetical protein [Portunus trituberculatus]
MNTKKIRKHRNGKPHHKTQHAREEHSQKDPQEPADPEDPVTSSLMSRLYESGVAMKRRQI